MEEEEEVIDIEEDAPAAEGVVDPTIGQKRKFTGHYVTELERCCNLFEGHGGHPYCTLTAGHEGPHEIETTAPRPRQGPTLYADVEAVTATSKRQGPGLYADGSGRERKGVPCRRCANCVREDCGTCVNCKDKKKFGGRGTRKQPCVHKRCMEKVVRQLDADLSNSAKRQRKENGASAASSSAKPRENDDDGALEALLEDDLGGGSAAAAAANNNMEAGAAAAAMKRGRGRPRKEDHLLKHPRKTASGSGGGDGGGVHIQGRAISAGRYIRCVS